MRETAVQADASSLAHTIEVKAIDGENKFLFSEATSHRVIYTLLLQLFHFSKFYKREFLPEFMS
jgi:hypothetical protein